VTDDRKVKLQEQSDAQNKLNEAKTNKEQRLEEMKGILENKKENLESTTSN